MTGIYKWPNRFVMLSLLFTGLMVLCGISAAIFPSMTLVVLMLVAFGASLLSLITACAWAWILEDREKKLDNSVG